MSRNLDDLAPAFKPLAIELIARCAEAGIPVMIVDTLRTAEEQAEKVALKLSWTAHSRHQDGLAIDVVPYELYQAHGIKKLDWDVKDPVWQIIGKIGQGLGLKWGVVMNGQRKDLGHFELVPPAQTISA